MPLPQGRVRISPTPQTEQIVPGSRSRNVINEVVPGKVYQRGQILTWQRDKKYELLRQYGIKTVVNFWPKADPDLAESPLDNYLLLAAPRSEQMLEDRIEWAADYVARLVEHAPVLILCEAGVTRSVYFCVLLAARLEGVSLNEAYRRVSARLRCKLKRFMLARLARG